MSERYEISDQGDGTAIVIDTHTDQPVYTADGTRVYEAPTKNAQWTADRLNRAEARKSAPAPEPTPESEPVRPNSAALLHVMAHAEPVEEPRPRPVISAMTSAVLRIETEPENLADWERELLALPLAEPTPVVRPVEKVDYPRMAGKAIGSIGVLSGRLASIGRWLDALEDGSVSPEFAMRQLRQAQTEAHKYAEDIYEELSAR